MNQTSLSLQKNVIRTFDGIIRVVCDCFAVSECLIELEPMVRKFDEIDFLEAVLEIKRSTVSQKVSHMSLF